ncbi:MAG: cell division protein ZapE [Gammaproteobacteria bacterium]|nr:cell division protein ZapE [Gammaproteobacteria bacterium]
MTLLEQYQAAVLTGDIRHDPRQRNVVVQLQALLEALNYRSQPWCFWRRWSVVKGLYLYGPVGGGKTFLMDLFYNALPERKKARYHFHFFMQQIDAALRQRQGQREPVERIATELAKRVQVLCLDEFFVQDVTQASVLVLLLQALFKRNITLIVTSNTPPDQLYLNGVNRARFLPAIALIHRYCDCVELVGLQDYRLGCNELPIRYVTPLGFDAETTLSKAFDTLEPQAVVNGRITIQRRDIPYVRRGDTAIWFEFKVICQVPRCQLDYLELADRFNVVFLSNIPMFNADETVPVLLLMYLVDVLYDRGRGLILSAAVDIGQLYQAGPMLAGFERTKSRLTEMKSAHYPTHRVDHLGFITPPAL